LKLKHDEPLSNFALNFNLRRYAELQAAERVKFCDEADGAGFGVDVFEAWIVKKPPVVRRCRLNR
jgi:hypothetical protein